MSNKSNKKQVQVNDIDTQLEAITSVSGKIRFLSSQGMTRGEIAKKLGKRYQHVRNVLTQPLKKEVK